MILSCNSMVVLACMDKSCAPPPVGTGGSNRSASSRGGRPVSGSNPSGDALTWAMDQDGRQRALSFAEEIGKIRVDQAAKQMSMRAIADELMSSNKGRKALRSALDAASGDVGAMREIAWTYRMSSMLGVSGRTTVRDAIQKMLKADPTSLEARGMFEQLGLNPATAKDADVETVFARICASSMLNAWAASSSTSEISVRQQEAASVEHGVPVGARMKARIDHLGSVRDERVRDLDRALVRAEYAATQKFLKETLGPDVKTVRLYRGVQNQHMNAKNGDVVSTELNPLSSWAFQLYTAQDFAAMAGGSGLVLAMDVPIEMIQSTPYTGRGCLGENEIVLIGRPSEATAALWGKRD